MEGIDHLPMTDTEMMARIAGGDAHVFEQFYDRHASLLYAVLLKMLGDQHRAEEALQETFSQAWRTAESFDGTRGSAIAWLIQIGRSRALDRIRAENLRTERESEAAVEERVFSGSRRQVTGFQHASMLESQDAVRRALSEIPEEQRKPIELAFYRGMTQREIATALDQPLGTVKTRILLGMKKLRKCLSDFHSELKR